MIPMCAWRCSIRLPFPKMWLLLLGVVLPGDGVLPNSYYAGEVIDFHLAFALSVDFLFLDHLINFWFVT